MTQPYEAGTIPVWTQPDRLRKAREHAGLSQDQLADRVGISRRSVSTYEANGTSKRPVLLAWALVCGVPLSWLLPRLDSNQQPAGKRLTLVA